MRVQKFLASLGFGSRRYLETMVSSGRVFVNGQVAQIGQRVSLYDCVSFDGKEVLLRHRWVLPRLILYNKPTGEIVSHADPKARQIVFDRLPLLKSGRWLSVGRLDFNTEGLLLLTNSGDLVNFLSHPRYRMTREYVVRLMGSLNLKQRKNLLSGVYLSDGLACFTSITDLNCRIERGLNHWYRVALNEGRNREIHRVFQALGFRISRLIRVKYGNIVLPRCLKKGKWLEWSPNSVKDFCQSIGFLRRKIT